MTTLLRRIPGLGRPLRSPPSEVDEALAPVERIKSVLQQRGAQCYCRLQLLSGVDDEQEFARSIGEMKHANIIRLSESVPRDTTMVFLASS